MIDLIPLFKTSDDPGFIDIMVRTMKPMFCSADDYIIEEGKVTSDETPNPNPFRRPSH